MEYVTLSLCSVNVTWTSSQCRNGTISGNFNPGGGNVGLQPIAFRHNSGYDKTVRKFKFFTEMLTYKLVVLLVMNLTYTRYVQK